MSALIIHQISISSILSQVKKGQEVTDYRFFLRAIIRHSDLVTKEASFEYLQNEGERMLLEALDELELAFSHPDVSQVLHVILVFIAIYFICKNMVWFKLQSLHCGMYNKNEGQLSVYSQDMSLYTLLLKLVFCLLWHTFLCLISVTENRLQPYLPQLCPCRLHGSIHTREQLTLHGTTIWYQAMETQGTSSRNQTHG